MYIKKYDLFEYLPHRNNYGSIDYRDNYIHPVSLLLEDVYPCIKKINFENFIKKQDLFEGIGVFEKVELVMDDENNLVYISDAYDDDYRSRIMNLTKSMILGFCLDGSLDYNIMTKDNFFHLLLSWDKYFNQLIPFILLYQDGKDWYDLLPFDSQEAMKKFVADHTKSETIIQK